MWGGAPPPFADQKWLLGSSQGGPSDRRPAVFLHGMWRSGSTFLWTRFREDPQTCCFYEPLHHSLCKLTPERIAQDTAERITASRHPAMADPYFAEFAPLVGGKGVRGFRKRLAYDRFVLEPGACDPMLKRYVTGLIEHAQGQGRAAVLGFNRTGLRLGWMKAQFDAYNIYIDREPTAIWASYAAELARGNCGFYSLWLTVLEKNARHPVFAPLVERLGLTPPVTGLLRKPKKRHREVLAEMNQEELYFMVFYLWLACTGHALAQSDLVIDTRLAETRHYGARISAEIRRATGLAVDLSEMRAAEPRVELSLVMRDRIERSAVAMFPRHALPRNPAAARCLASVSPRKAERLAAVV
jgi:hypothetical protein